MSQNKQAGEYLKHLLGCVERRRKKRVEASIPIKVKGADVQGNHFEEETESINISAGGACFYLKQRIRVGSTLELSLLLPQSTRNYLTSGRAIRVEDVGGPRAYKIAVKFGITR